MKNLRTTCMLVGLLSGVAISSWVWHWESAGILAGRPPHEAGFGSSHLLFVVSLPWSFIPLAAGWLASAAGIESAGFSAAIFYSMPILAGAAWGSLAGKGFIWLRRRDAA